MKITKHSLKAGILPTTIGIVLLLVVMSSTMILMGYYHRMHIHQLKRSADQGVLLQQGVQLALAAYADDQLNEQWQVFPLFPEGQDSIRIKLKTWGVMEVCQLERTAPFQHWKKAFFVGQHGERLRKEALFLSDQKSPLAISGAALIKGDAALPLSGIKKNYFNRQAYSRSELVFGNISHSTAKMPPLNSNLSEFYEKAMGLVNNVSQDSLLRYGIQQSFGSDTVAHCRLEQPWLHHAEAEGQVVISHPDSVVVMGSSSLSSIVVCAPKIIIASDYEGEIQALAADTLIVEQGAQLQYPSILVCLGKSKEALLQIEKEAQLSGQALLLCSSGEQEEQNFILEKNAQIMGSVYWLSRERTLAIG